MRFQKLFALCALGALHLTAHAATHLIEAEDFQFPGEWLEERDTEALGSRMMRTPGANADAQTVIDLLQGGHYSLWVRARDYAEFPGKRRYQIAIDGEVLPREAGAHGSVGWKWEQLGTRDLAAGEHVLAL